MRITEKKLREYGFVQETQHFLLDFFVRRKRRYLTIFKNSLGNWYISYGLGDKQIWTMEQVKAFCFSMGYVETSITHRILRGYGFKLKDGVFTLEHKGKKLASYGKVVSVDGYTLRTVGELKEYLR